MHRDCVGDFVGDDRALEFFRQLVDVLRLLPEKLLLSVLQLGAGLQDQVFTIQFLQKRAGERAAGGAELEDAPARNFAELAREGAAEEIAEFRRGDEVTRRAELARAARVVAALRRVQRELHIARERDPAALALDL